MIFFVKSVVSRSFEILHRFLKSQKTLILDEKTGEKADGYKKKLYENPYENCMISV